DPIVFRHVPYLLFSLCSAISGFGFRRSVFLHSRVHMPCPPFTLSIKTRLRTNFFLMCAACPHHGHSFPLSGIPVKVTTRGDKKHNSKLFSLPDPSSIFPRFNDRRALFGAVQRNALRGYDDFVGRDEKIGDTTKIVSPKIFKIPKAPRAGLEPATYWLTASRYCRLSYRGICNSKHEKHLPVNTS